MHPVAVVFALLLAGSPYTCSWVFTGGLPSASTSCQPPQVTFPRAGAKRITLTVCLGPLCGTTEQTLQVFEARPRILRIDSLPRPAYEEEPVTLAAEVSGKHPLAYSWKLPDGAVLSGNPVVIAPGRLSPSSRNVWLTVTNQSGKASSVVSPQILSAAPRIRSIALSASAVHPGSMITAKAEATGRPPLTFRWTFPDGTILEGRKSPGSSLSCPPGAIPSLSRSRIARARRQTADRSASSLLLPYGPLSLSAPDRASSGSVRASGSPSPLPSPCRAWRSIGAATAPTTKPSPLSNPPTPTPPPASSAHGFACVSRMAALRYVPPLAPSRSPDNHSRRHDLSLSFHIL
jgi:hypothetical protein